MKFKNMLYACICLSMIACSNVNQEEKNQANSKEFTELANEEEFREKHEEPDATKAFDLKGEMTKFEVVGGDSARMYQAAAKNNTNKYILVFHEWWGLNHYVKAETEKLADQLGVHAYALDLYDGKVATERPKAQEYMQGADEERIRKIIKAAIANLPADADLATMGWCFGGGWSLKAAIMAVDKAKACVMYYGMPVKEASELERLAADVLFIYGTKDQWINKEVASNFKQLMDENDKVLEVVPFEADHAFANPTQDHFKESAARKANEISMEFLENTLVKDDNDIIEH